MPRRYQGALVVCALLIGYASLYPFVPLRGPGYDAVAIFFTPRFFPFDFFLNVLAYMPFGLIACRRFREDGRAQPIVYAILLGTALSFALEMCQLFVPYRVSSLFDVFANALGTALGAAFYAEPLHTVVTKPFGEARERLFTSGLWGDAGLVLVVLWLLAQLNPALPFFGAGNITEEASHRVEILLVIAVGLSICGFALFVSTLMRSGSGGLRMTVVLLSVALWLKFAASSVMLKPNFAAEWVSWGRVMGLVSGTIVFFPMRKLGRLARIYLAIVFMLAGALFSKIFGSYEPIEQVLRFFNWPHGQLAGFATLTGFMHELWPFVAILFLIGFFFHTRKVSTMLERTQTLESRPF